MGITDPEARQKDTGIMRPGERRGAHISPAEKQELLQVATFPLKAVSVAFLSSTDTFYQNSNAPGLRPGDVYDLL